MQVSTITHRIDRTVFLLVLRMATLTLLKPDVAKIQAFDFYMTNQRRILDRVPTIASVKSYCHYVVCQLWTQQANTYYDGGQGHYAPNVTECQTACIATTGCDGFDWYYSNERGLQCWLSGTWSGARGSVQHVTHYILDRSCTGNDFKKISVILMAR